LGDFRHQIEGWVNRNPGVRIKNWEMGFPKNPWNEKGEIAGG